MRRRNLQFRYSIIRNSPGSTSPEYQYRSHSPVRDRPRVRAYRPHLVGLRPARRGVRSETAHTAVTEPMKPRQIGRGFVAPTNLVSLRLQTTLATAFMLATWTSNNAKTRPTSSTCSDLSRDFAIRNHATSCCWTTCSCTCGKLRKRGDSGKTVLTDAVASLQDESTRVFSLPRAARYK